MIRTFIKFPKRADEAYRVHKYGNKTVTVDSVVSIDLTKIKILNIIFKSGDDSKMLYSFLKNYRNGFAYFDTDKKEIRFFCQGIATCHKDDTFDFELGIKIAETKMQRNAFLIAGNFYNALLDMLYDKYGLNMLNAAPDNCYALQFDTDEHARIVLGKGIDIKSEEYLSMYQEPMFDDL